jgi:hypothetical protein
MTDPLLRFRSEFPIPREDDLSDQQFALEPVQDESVSSDLVEFVE